MKNIIVIVTISVIAGSVFSQNLGIGEPSPGQKLDVLGWVKVGNENTGTTATTGTIRYHSSGRLQFYNGSAWVSLPPDRSTTFINWGRNDCPAGSSLVYNGQAASKHYQHNGSGTNTLCLTNSPNWTGASFNDASVDASLIYGVEFQMSGYGIASFGNGLTSGQLQDYDAECAVCLVDGASETMMVPGTNVCPSGWTLRYWGYLMGNHYTQTKNETVCVNNSPLQTGVNSDCNGNLWYPTEVELGVLNGSPYFQDRELTCAVCTK